MSVRVQADSGSDKNCFTHAHCVEAAGSCGWKGALLSEVGQGYRSL